MSDKRIPFTAEDEDRIASAALWGQIVAVVGIVSSAIDTALNLINGAGLRTIVNGGITLLITVFLGVWLIQAGKAFRAVARTDVADKAYLLQGFDKLHKYFLTIGVVNIVLIVAVVAMFLLTLIFGTAMLARIAP